jgi:hypothetical protein
MDILLVLLAIGGVLLFYQLVIYKDPDKLDKRGRDPKKRNK